MALWGNNDNVTTARAGIITASGFNGAVTGSGTTFTNYSVGQTVTLGIGMTSGFGVIETITSNTVMALHDHSLPGSLDDQVGVYTGRAFIVGERPVSLTNDPAFAPTTSDEQRGYTTLVYGVNKEIQEARQTSNSQYTPTHAGWVGVTTYNDCDGNLRVKSETYVAMSGISSQTQVPATVLPS
tara:strand:- start:684 stop:1232 length:549 start_codon:yes stop_codon:yes gene_type:complete